MNGWLWVAAGAAAVFVGMVFVWPWCVVSRRDDKAHGRLEEQQP